MKSKVWFMLHGICFIGVTVIDKIDLGNVVHAISVSAMSLCLIIALHKYFKELREVNRG